MNDEIFDLLNKSLVDLGKVSASCSGIHQASDVSTLFKDAKKLLDKFTRNEQDVSNPVVHDAIIDAIAHSQVSSVANIPSEMKTKIIYACLSITYTLKEAMSPGVIAKGFQRSGQYPLSFETIMSRCYRDIDDKQLGAMEQTTEDDLAFFLSNGYISEAQLDKSNIPTNEENPGVLRDEKQLSNQRGVLLSHPQTRNRYLDYMNQGLPLGDAVVKVASGKEKKELKAAIKIVSTEEKKLVRAEKRKEDKARIASLSLEEKKALQAEKQAKKQAKEAEKKDKVAKAQQTLSVYTR